MKKKLIKTLVVNDNDEAGIRIILKLKKSSYFNDGKEIDGVLYTLVFRLYQNEGRKTLEELGDSIISMAPDALIIDFDLSDWPDSVNGTELQQYIREHYRKVPIFILTSYFEECLDQDEGNAYDVVQASTLEIKTSTSTKNQNEKDIRPADELILKIISLVSSDKTKKEKNEKRLKNLMAELNSGGKKVDVQEIVDLNSEISKDDFGLAHRSPIPDEAAKSLTAFELGPALEKMNSFLDCIEKNDNKKKPTPKKGTKN
jgi:hypothetical protein